MEEYTRIHDLVLETFNACPHPILALGPVMDGRESIVDFVLQGANAALGVFLGRPGIDLCGCLLRRDMPILGSYGLFEVYVTALQLDRTMQLDLYLEERDKWVEMIVVKRGDGLVVTLTDVTENRLLKQNNRDLQQFAFTAAHDLQEPLRKILLFSHLLKDKYGISLDEMGMSYLDKILRSAGRTQSLVTDILAYSSLSNKAQFERVSLKTIISDVLEDFEQVFQDKQATVFLDPLPEADVRPGQIRQVFQNLIGNALKFTREGIPPVLRISGVIIGQPSFDAPAQNDGAYVRIHFLDNGIGFDPQFATTIFGLFQRLHSKDKFEGTGIGLATAKKIIEAHGGLITAKGREGKGAEFSVILPLRQPRF